VCENAIELNLCENTSLSENCLTDWQGGSINLYGTGITGGCNYQWFQFDNDQWFTFNIEEETDIIIDLNTNYQAPLNGNCTLNSNGTNQGIVIILWTGNNCSDMFPILNSWNPSWCNGVYTIPNCPYGQSTCLTQCGNNSNLPSNIDPTHPAYITTAYSNYSCCVNWFNSCNNTYNLQLLLYNLSFNNWVIEQNGTTADGIIPDINPQDFLISIKLPAGQYWIQLDPISCNPNNGGYVSEGTGTINVCNLFFLNLENTDSDNYENIKESESIEINKFKKIIHPLHGLLIYDTFKNKYYDIRMREIKIK
jgi:hypothetical protein